MVKHRIAVTVVVDIEHNESMLPDDEWREEFYSNIKTQQDVAEHIAYNVVANGVEDIRKLDGFADRDSSDMRYQVHTAETEVVD